MKRYDTKIDADVLVIGGIITGVIIGIVAQTVLACLRTVYGA